MYISDLLAVFDTICISVIREDYVSKHQNYLFKVKIFMLDFLDFALQQG